MLLLQNIYTELVSEMTPFVTAVLMRLETSTITIWDVQIKKDKIDRFLKSSKLILEFAINMEIILYKMFDNPDFFKLVIKFISSFKKNCNLDIYKCFMLLYN